MILATSLALSAAAPLAAADAEAPTATDVAFFETHIRPILVEHCYECHSGGESDGGLVLESRETTRRGGNSGQVIVAGQPDASRLIEAVRYDNRDLQMPPQNRLSSSQVAALEKWVSLGAPDPRESPPSTESDDSAIAPTGMSLAEGKDFWSFKAIIKPELPRTNGSAWIKSPIDAFILAELEDQGLEPSPAADRRTLIRRVTQDLIGLPPTSDEIEAFANDPRPDAYERLVERLLSSPQYGVRWGRHWLDVARYADSNGLDENLAYGNAWRYRDYVVDAFNVDMPYDQFVSEQVAGDLLPDADADTKTATGFLVLGAKVLAEPDREKLEMDTIDEQLDSISKAFLGLTFGCARCHDHKFDPIRQADYYALAAIFKSTRTFAESNTGAIKHWNEHVFASDDELEALKTVDAEIAKLKAVAAAFKNEAVAKFRQVNESLATPFTFDETESVEYGRLMEAARLVESAAPDAAAAMGVQDREIAKSLPLHIRGSHLNLGESVTRGFPQVMQSSANETVFPDDQSGRLELAQWMASPDHPLTARVFVNRVWRWHFGEGLVRSTDNFGVLGDRPSHPELLDWLASEWIAQNWSTKSLHRLILRSSTYQMSSSHPQARQYEIVDPANRWRWRFQLHRLEAEQIRDSILAVANRLDTTLGGKTVPLRNRQFVFDHTSLDFTKYDSLRRAAYLPVIRNNLYTVFEQFDFPDPTVPTGDRNETVVAPQSLLLMNSDWVMDSAETIARDLLRASASDASRVDNAYRNILGRPATEAETTRALAFLDPPPSNAFTSKAFTSDASPSDASPNDPQRSWALFCQSLLIGNEFMHVR